MSTARGLIVHKHYRLDEAKIKRAQKVLKAGTETETLDRALEAVIAEDERNRLTREANERFVKSGIEIRDVYGKLEEKRRQQPEAKPPVAIIKKPGVRKFRLND